MRNTSSASFARSAAYALMLGLVAAPAASSALMAQDPQQPYGQTPVAYSADQLNNLVAPVALYADPLLAQVLLAATFPDQIANAAEYVRQNGTNGIDDQYWDVSVKAVAHYPTVLNMMDQRIDWTTSLGQAYAQQSSDVMQAVQYMRAMARDQGNLQNTAEQQVVYTDGNICIWPAQAQYIYVPVYDPAVVYFRPVFVRPGFHGYFSFGVGYPIGAWLMYDWDWPARRIVYTGWYGGGWIARSRPFIRITNVYVNAGYRHVNYGHDVIYRRPDYGHVRVYGGIGHDVNFRDHDHGGRNDHNGGGTAQPRGGHGVVTTGGYRQPTQGNIDSHQRVTPSNNSSARRMPASSVPQSQGRTAQPRQDGWRSAPNPVYVRPQTVDRPHAVTRPPEVQPRVAQPRAPDVHVRSEPPRGPAPSVLARPAPPPSHAAPSQSHSAPSQSRSAHRRGSGNE